MSPGRVLGCREPRLRSLAVDSSAGEDPLVPASRVSAWELVRPGPGLGGSGGQPPPENSPCLVPGAPLAEGAAAANLLSRPLQKAEGRPSSFAPEPSGAGEEEETRAFCTGDSWARLGIFPGCGHPRVSGARRAWRAPGSWSRLGPGRERLLPRRPPWTWGPCPVPFPVPPPLLEASEFYLFLSSSFPAHLSSPSPHPRTRSALWLVPSSVTLLSTYS